MINLIELKLNDSVIKTTRDLGTSFRKLQVLHISRCEVQELAGICAFDSLQELYCAHNFIDDLFDVGFLENLRILDLEGNNVKGIDNLYSLRPLHKLFSLALNDNPVSTEISYVKVL